MSDPEQSQYPSLWRARFEQLRLALPTASSPRSAITIGAAIAATAAILGLGAWLFLRQSPPPVPIDLPRAGSAGQAESAPGAPASAPSEAAGTITVAAGGAVISPGVYVVPSKARVADVITAAGGTSPDADLDQLNLAAKVADADRVFVPRQGQAVPSVVGPGAGPAGNAGSTASGGASANDTPLDLNTATADQLDALPGVGPATAQSILAYRQSHGRFKSINELLEVRGIGPAKFEALRTLVRVT